MKTLIAVDDGPESRDAVGFAKRLLASENQVIVLNVASYDVAPSMAIGTFGAGVYVDPALDPLDREDPAADEAARDIVHRAGQVLGAADERVEHGEVASKICQVAEQESVDLIILGTHDRGLWSRFWFGSVSDRVVRDAPCSVLVVR